MTYDPIEKLNETIARARDSGDAYADAAVLATAGEEGAPSARMLLVKKVDRAGLVFYTNLNSRKAQELKANPRASLCFWWPGLQIQIRAEGTVEPVGHDEADAYFAGRPRGSQIGAWASNQSAELPGRDTLTAAFAEAAERFGDGPVPRPPHWSGFRLVPRVIEVWQGRPDRLHHRLRFARRGDTWEPSLLYP